jgi:homogentisate 1,2-dioxygenase
MPFSTNPKVQIVDASGDACDDDSGKLNVNATIGVGTSTFTSYAQVTQGTTRQTITAALSVSAVTTCKEIILQADFDNAGFIMVGDGAVEAETEGIKLNAGDMLVLPISSTDNVSIDADQASQKVNINIIT